MLWLCILPYRLSLECLHDGADATGGSADALAVVQSKGSRRWIVESNAAITPGTDVGAARALHALSLVERRPEAEREALDQLAYLAYRFGHPVYLQRSLETAVPTTHAVWVEIEASLQLFGGMAALLDGVRAAIAERSLSVHLGVAPTLEGARLAAGDEQILDRRTFRRWLDPQPLSALSLPPGVREVLLGSGLRHVEQVLRLDVASMARRFGTEATTYLKRLTGELPDPRRSIVPPGQFHRRLELFGRIDTVERLLLALRRLLVELEHYLRARDVGVLGFTLELSHEDRQFSLVEVGFATPSRDANHFLLVARERLERLPLKGPAIEMRLHAERFDSADVAQYDLFDRESNRQRDWQTLLERLIARWGSEAVWSLGLVADHRPERAWRKLAPGQAAGTVEAALRPNWLLDRPRRIERPQLMGEPERIEAGWWNERVDRDYYVASGRGGTRLWVYRDHRDLQWYLHGLFG